MTIYDILSKFVTIIGRKERVENALWTLASSDVRL